MHLFGKVSDLPKCEYQEMLSYEKHKLVNLESHFVSHPSIHYISLCLSKFKEVNVSHPILWPFKIDLSLHHIYRLDHKLIHLNTLSRVGFYHFNFDMILNLKELHLIY